MSQQEEIQRICVDFYNDKNSTVPAITNYNSRYTIVEHASDYHGYIEFAETSLSDLVLDVTPQYTMMILNDEGGKPGNRFPYLPDYVNLFKFDGELKDVEQLRNWFYNVLHKQTLPFSLGNLTLDKKGYFRRTVTQEEFDDSFQSGLFKVYVDVSLRRLLPEFTSDSDTMIIKGVTWWNLQSTPQDVTQETDTLAQLLKAVSIRFYSTMGTTDYNVYNQSKGEFTKQSLLTTIAINNLTTDIINKTSKRYEPAVFRPITFSHTGPIRDFAIEAHIYYVNGETRAHKLQPGDYMNIQIAFVPKNQKYSVE